MRKKVRFCVGEGYERYGQKIVILKPNEKPEWGALFRRRTKYYRQYVRGTDNIFIPNKGVKITKCSKSKNR